MTVICSEDSCHWRTKALALAVLLNVTFVSMAVKLVDARRTIAAQREALSAAQEAMRSSSATMTRATLLLDACGK